MIVDAFAGAGGWSEGLRSLGLHDVGLEWDRDCCLTRQAAGHLTVRADVTAYPPEPFAGRCAGLLASPPCQAFSMAGKGDGRRDMPRLHRAVELCRAGWTDAALEGPWRDPRNPLILQPLRWAWAIRPRWIACEQVPPALPIWEHMADVLRSWGYAARAVRLLAADYGVPQTRLRAFLLASLDGPVRVPEPTHARHPKADLFGAARLPWVSMAAALGWMPGDVDEVRNYHVIDPHPHANGGAAVPTFDPNDLPSRTLTHRVAGWTLDAQRNATERNATERNATEPAPTIKGGHSFGEMAWVLERPATRVAGTFLMGGDEACVIPPPGHREFADVSRQDADGAVRITLAEAAVLQGMRPDYPFQGTKTSRFRQCGDLVPPAVARAVVAALRGAR